TQIPPVSRRGRQKYAERRKQKIESQPQPRLPDDGTCTEHIVGDRHGLRCFCVDITALCRPQDTCGNHRHCGEKNERFLLFHSRVPKAERDAPVSVKQMKLKCEPSRLVLVARAAYLLGI